MRQLPFTVVYDTFDVAVNGRDQINITVTEPDEPSETNGIEKACVYVGTIVFSTFKDALN